MPNAGLQEQATHIDENALNFTGLIDLRVRGENVLVVSICEPMRGSEADDGKAYHVRDAMSELNPERKYRIAVDCKNISYGEEEMVGVLQKLTRLQVQHGPLDIFNAQPSLLKKLDIVGLTRFGRISVHASEDECLQSLSATREPHDAAAQLSQIGNRLEAHFSPAPTSPVDDCLADLMKVRASRVETVVPFARCVSFPIGEQSIVQVTGVALTEHTRQENAIIVSAVRRALARGPVALDLSGIDALPSTVVGPLMALNKQSHQLFGQPIEVVAASPAVREDFETKKLIRVFAMKSQNTSTD